MGERLIQKSLKIVEQAKAKWVSQTLPQIKGNEVLVQTLAGAISIGSELPIYNSPETVPIETGYESFAEVIEVGSAVEKLRVGDRILAFYGHKNCAVLKENEAILVPPHIRREDALLAILSCDAAKGVLKLNPRPNDNILVTGMGAMGLLSVHFLTAYMGLRHVDVVEPIDSRRTLAQKLGAHYAYADGEAVQSDHYKFGMECSANNDAFCLLQKAVKTKAKICILSDGNRGALRLEPAFHHKELTITASSDGWDYRAHAKWYFKHIAEQRSQLSEMFERRIAANELIQCFADLNKGKINPIKVLVDYQTTT